jgi:hypothetical protein
MAKNYHVVPFGDKWAVKEERTASPFSIHNTQREGIDMARGLAQHSRSEVVIHRPNGRIRDKDSYGPDPCPPKDKKH